MPVPYPADLPAHDSELEGRPAVVTLASASWLPSRETARTVAESWWPVVRRTLPEAVLHIFGGVGDDDDDCSCRVSGRSGAPSMSLLALLTLALLRRRR